MISSEPISSLAIADTSDTKNQSSNGAIVSGDSDVIFFPRQQEFVHCKSSISSSAISEN